MWSNLMRNPLKVGFTGFDEMTNQVHIITKRASCKSANAHWEKPPSCHTTNHHAIKFFI